MLSDREIVAIGGETMALDIDADEHKWLPELMKLIKIEKGKFWFKLLNFCLYVHDFDPYAIFKGKYTIGQACDTKQHVQQLIETFHNNSEKGASRLCARNFDLQMSHTSDDEFRRKITAPVRVFAAYNLIKSLIISLAQHTRMRYDHLVAKYRHSRPLMSLELAHSIANYLGMPYYDLKDISLAFISTSSCFFFVCTVALPLYYRRHPMNIAQLRFLLDPSRELKRVDASVRCRLATISTSLGVYRNSKLATNRQRHLSSRLFESKQSYGKQWQANQRDELQYCYRIEARIGQFCESKSSFRPSTFAPRAYKKLVGRAKLLVLGTLATYSTCGVFIWSCLFYSAYSNKCPRLDCNPFDVLTGPELLVMLETMAYIVITCASSLLNATLFAMLTLCQLDLIGAFRAELVNCHQALVGFVYLSRDAKANSRDKLECLMLKSIARVSVYDRELRDNARCISEQTVQPACYLASAVLLAAINVQFKLPATGVLRWFVVCLLWLTVNSVAISCANIHARVLALRQQLWSVLAASSRLLTEDNNHYQRGGGSNANLPQFVYMSVHQFKRRPQLAGGTRAGMSPFSFVTDLWHKFVVSTSSNAEQHCSRLLNIKLNYQTIIEANFFSIFIYSLTLAHDN